MTAPLSIIIPTLNAERALLRLLPQLVEGLTARLIAELILADGGSQDQTAALAEEAGAVFIPAPKGRGCQLHAGAQAAKGRWFLVLHADSQMPPNWVDAVQTHMQNYPKDAASFALAFNDTSLMAGLTAGWANLRTRLFSLPYGDQGLLIPARLYAQIGGYPEVPLMEDVMIAKKLRGRLRLMPCKITTDAEKYRRYGWIKRGARNLTTLALFKLGRSPERLAARYDPPDHKSS